MWGRRRGGRRPVVVGGGRPVVVDGLHPFHPAVYGK